MGLRLLGFETHGNEHSVIVFCLFLRRHGIGTAAAGHAVKSKRALLEAELAVFAHAHALGVNAIMAREERCGQLSGCHHGLTARQRAEHPVEVSAFYHLQVFVRCGPCGASDAQAGVKQGNTRLGKKTFQLCKAVGLLRLADEMLFVAKVDESEDSPHVIHEIGIIPWHAPSLWRRGKGAEHQQPGIFRHKWLERMGFYFSFFHAGVAISAPAVGCLQDTTSVGIGRLECAVILTSVYVAEGC